MVFRETYQRKMKKIRKCSKSSRNFEKKVDKIQIKVKKKIKLINLKQKEIEKKIKKLR